MKIGGKYRLYEIRSRQWRELADLLELDGKALLERRRRSRTAPALIPPPGDL